ncbi:D(4) dopamine receptor, partial [Carlito syrichta]|uniref:D(4) dopamine receptor n=1 Tax=Carlito syrichta TaxID=1868482 RepID=A0A1U7SXI4_CARSF
PGGPDCPAPAPSHSQGPGGPSCPPPVPGLNQCPCGPDCPSPASGHLQGPSGPDCPLSLPSINQCLCGLDCPLPTPDLPRGPGGPDCPSPACIHTQSPCGPDCPTPPASQAAELPPQTPPQARRSRRAKITGRERKAMRVLPVVVGAFLLCWTPFFVVHITRALCPACAVPARLVSAVTWLGYVNSALNPIIYTIFNAEFRNVFRKAVRACC